MLAEGHVKTARGGQWRETTVQRILDAERADRAAMTAAPPINHET
jgi:hypothetical protein